MLGGRVRAGRDAVRRPRAGRRAAAHVVGGVGRRAAARGHARRERFDRPAQRCATATCGSSWRSRTGARSRSRPGRRGRARRRCAVTGSAVVGGRTIAIDSAGLLDESAGRHARRTAWRWSAGAGVAASGAAVVWNLVEGLHDGDALGAHGLGRRRAARGRPRSRSTGSTASATCASPRRPCAPSARTTSSIASDYEQPFGTFTGALPVAGAAARAGASWNATGALVILAARRAGRGDRGRAWCAARPCAGGAGGARRGRACCSRVGGAVVGRRDRRGAGARADAGRARLAARARRRVRAGGGVRRARGAAGGGCARVRAAAADAGRRRGRAR